MAGTLLIRADAGEGIGTGHVMRSLALAQAWQVADGRAILLGQCPAPLAERVRAAGVRFEPLSCRHPDPVDLSTTLALAERARSECRACTMPDGDVPRLSVLLDGYHFDAAYQWKMREMGCRLLVIDDMAHLPHYHGDLVLNQNLGAEQLRYVTDEHTVLLLGPRYALLRPEFRQYEPAGRTIPETARKVLVTLGGEDPDNVTQLAIRALEQLDLPGLEARIVVGPANPHLAALRAEIGRSSANLKLLTNVRDMPGLMAWADVAVTAAGITCWELAFMQVPAVAMVLAENQRTIAEPLGRAGAVTNLGWFERIAPDALSEAIGSLCCDHKRRVGQSEAGRRLVDGRGADRAIAITEAMDGTIPEEQFTLRPVTEDDMLPLWRLANAPSVRLNSLSPDPIPLDAHVSWFHEKIASPHTRMWALELHGLLVGQIRYDRAEEKTALVSLSVAAPFRRRGLGTMLVERTGRLASQQLGAKRLRAEVRRENTPSVRIFIKSGFTQVTSKPVCGKACYIFEQEL